MWLTNTLESLKLDSMLSRAIRMATRTLCTRRMSRPLVEDRLESRSHRSDTGYRCETLESRRLLCGIPLSQLLPAPEFDSEIEHQEASRLATRGGPESTSIVWSNRGQPSDNFDATFGTSAGIARNVVDAALAQWQRIITNWNRDDGSTSLQVNISIGGSGFGGAGAPAGTAPADGKPRTGSFAIGNGNNSANPNDSNGWYLDPQPDDYVEFNGPILNAYAGQPSSGLGPDFYSVVIAELTDR